MENVTGWGTLHAPIADYAIKTTCAEVSSHAKCMKLHTANWNRVAYANPGWTGIHFHSFIHPDSFYIAPIQYLEPQIGFQFFLGLTFVDLKLI